MYQNFSQTLYLINKIQISWIRRWVIANNHYEIWQRKLMRYPNKISFSIQWHFKEKFLAGKSICNEYICVIKMKMASLQVSLTNSNQPSLGINLGKISQLWYDRKTLFQARRLWVLDNRIRSINMFYSEHFCQLYYLALLFFDERKMQKLFFSSFLNIADFVKI